MGTAKHGITTISLSYQHQNHHHSSGIHKQKPTTEVFFLLSSHTTTISHCHINTKKHHHSSVIHKHKQTTKSSSYCLHTPQQYLTVISIPKLPSQFWYPQIQTHNRRILLTNLTHHNKLTSLPVTKTPIPN